MSRRLPAGRSDNGIEALIAARRGATPSREELVQRTQALTAHLTAREGTPGEVSATDRELSRPTSARQMGMHEFELALRRIEEGHDLDLVAEDAHASSDERGGHLTAMQMANALGEQLRLAPAPMTTLVEQAKATLGLQIDSGTMISQLRMCYEHATGVDAGGGAATSAPAGGGGSLLDGTFDEAESNASFAAALADFRGLPAEQQQKKKKGPPLGERLLAKGLVNGCST